MLIQKRFRPQKLSKSRITESFMVCVLFFVVLVFLHNSSRRVVVPTHKLLKREADLNEKIATKTAAVRKLLADHGMPVPPTGSTYQRIVLISTWRSGSTFTGELLSNIPGSVYNFEPFRYFGIHDISVNNETTAAEYVSKFEKLLQCDYTPLLGHYRGLPLFKKQFLEKNAAYQVCAQIEAEKNCSTPELLSQASWYFPVQITKFVRMPLRYVLPLLRRQPELNLHVILLVRDPRGTMASRRLVGWCDGDCADPEILCNLLRDNYESATKMAKEFPERFTVLRYEDIAMDPENGAHGLLKRLGIPVTPSIGEYVETHAGSKVNKVGVTFRIRGSRITRWKKSLKWNDVQNTQKACQDVLDKYGYVTVPEADALNDTQTFEENWRFPVIHS